MRSSPSVVGAALAAAVRAPSVRRGQPWLFEVDGERIRLLLNRGELGASADAAAEAAAASEARLACGAALCNLRIALRAQDRIGFVDLLPDPADRDLLAVVRVAGERVASATEHRLADAIGALNVGDRRFLDRTVPTAARAALSSAAHTEGARLRFIDTAEQYHQVVGVLHAFGLNGVSDARARLTERQPSLVAVLTPSGGERYDVLAGAGMQRALLTATVLGLNATLVGRPLAEPAARDELSAALRGYGDVHTLLWIGYGEPVIAQPRTPIDEERLHQQ